ncbi:hypothetical protein LOK49_LG05G01381 [Camellia lanceoleosa]|uniref:Uncharacterized protein n=1 Tax=Camellia lanceoleosa TaxID=1840588 RepID=A0ACC0HTM3_9ERIC|nr:hypothetical protein LOK49_LG05G01381 [Camellia lanceoleosa]
MWKDEVRQIRIGGCKVCGSWAGNSGRVREKVFISVVHLNIKMNQHH